MTRTIGPRYTLAAVSLTLLASCSSDVEPASGEFERLNTQQVSSEVSAPTPGSVYLWESTMEAQASASWQVSTSGSSLIERDRRRVFRLERAQQAVEIRIPITFDYKERSLVTVEGFGGLQSPRVEVTLFAGEVPIATESASLRATKHSERATVLFPSPLEAATPATHVSISLAASEAPFFLTKVSLTTLPRGVSLDPNLFGGYELVQIEGDSRRATALVEGKAQTTQFESQGPGDFLKFSFGQTAQLEQATGDSQLVVTVAGEPFTFDLDSGADGERHWQSGSIPLDDFDVGPLEVSFELASTEGNGICLLSRPRHGTGSELPRTVLLITSDTHRSDHLGFLMEDGQLQTTAIDALASEGLVFLNAVSSINNTTPSHVALMTGLSPRDTGLLANARRLSDEAPTLAEAFHDLGYATLASVSASPVKHELSNLGQGFDRYGAPSSGVQDAEATIGRMMDWLDDYQGQPVFAWVHVFDAHGPYEPPSELVDLYYERGGPLKAGVMEASTAALAMAPTWDLSITDPNYTESLYKAEITYLDGELGKLFDLARIDRGVIALTADHGEVLRYGPGRPFDHWGLSLNTVAIPMILKAPGLVPGEQRADPVMHFDLGRTLLDLAGHSGQAFPGRNIIESEVAIDEPRFVIEANGLSAAVLTQRWMLVMNLREVEGLDESEESPFHSVRMFNIEEDKFCRYNVWEENLEMATALRELLLSWLEASEGNQWTASSVLDKEEIAKDLASLGYLSIDDSQESEWYDRSCDCAWCETFEQ